MRIEALVVGINNHIYDRSLNLKAPVNDAKAISEILEKYGKFHVQRLPKDYDEQGKERFILNGKVKSQDLETRISNLFNPMSKNEIPDVALFFFAGHGHVTTKGGIREGFLVTSDAQLKNEKYGISLNWFKELLKNSPVKKQIVWLDCCFSGELLNFEEADPGSGKEISRCFITASRSFETSMEKLDGTHGMFTSRLLKGLNPENSIDGWVTNYILADFIKKNMLDTAQAPVFHNSGDAIILTTNTPTEPIDERWQNTPPYRALSYFTEQEKDGVFFHGRTRLTDELIDRIRTHNFIAVLGASGSGKSSLLRAGLLYQLKRGQKISGSDRWQYLNPFTPTATPLENLQQAINIEAEKPENLTEKLIEFIQSAEAERVIMVIDQFEESFTLCETHEKRQEFFDCFLDAIENEAIQKKFCLILGMRADFLDQCSKYPGLATQIKEHQLLVTPLEKSEIEEAIKKPAELVGMGVEAGLVAQMTEDFLRNPGSLPLLQYTLDALWKYATQGEKKSKYLTLATYRKFGGIKGTLTKRANEVFESLSKEEKSVAKRIFLELVQPGHESINSDKVTDTRRRVILEDLPNELHSLELLLEVSDKLADQNNRLITKDKSEAGTLLDVIHEELIRSWEKLRNWVEEYQEALPLERKIEADAKEWKKQGEKDDWLWREGQLIKAEEYVTKYGDMGLLDGFACEFVRASQELRKRLEVEEEERKKREIEEGKAKKLAQKRNQVLSTFVVLMSGLCAFAWIQQRIAQHNSEVANVYQLGSKAEVLTTSNRHDTSVLLGVESMDKVKGAQKFLDSWWGKVVNKFSSGKVLDIPHSEADGAIRKGLTQLPDHLHTFNHESGVNVVAFSPDGQTIATASSDKTAHLWDADTGKKLATLSHESGVNVVAFSPDGQTIATASDDKTARLWDTDTGKELATLNHEADVNAVAFSPDGQTIATASDDKTVRLWDTDTGKELATFNHQSNVNKVAFSPDGKTIATASSDNTVRLWDATTREEFATLKHESYVNEIAFSPDGQTIATASYDKTARLWDRETGKQLATLNHEADVNAVAFSPDGQTIATASDDKTARLWDRETGKELATFNHEDKVYAVAFSPDGQTIATASDDNTARLWDADTEKQLATFNHEEWVYAVAFSPDGQTIATASGDNTARLWDADTEKQLATLNHDDWVIAVAFSPDGQTIATASGDNTARLWDRETGKELATLNHDDWVIAVAFSPDGQTIATASGDNTARLWDRETGKELATLNHDDLVIAVAFSPDGQTIATASYDNTARLWDRETGQELATFNHEGVVIAVAFSPDGQTIATASYDNTARLWDADTEKQLATFNHEGVVYAVSFSPDGQTIATASYDNTARLHLATRETLIAEACRRLGRNLTAQEWKQYMNSDFNKYEKTCEELPVHHRSLVAEAKKLAKTGDEQKRNEAISILKHTQKLEPEIDLDPDTKATETDVEVVVNKFVASGKIEKGGELAKDGKREEAISMFKEAQELSPEIDLYPNTETKETDPKVVADKFFAYGKIEKGKNSARQGKIEEAISLYDEAQKLDSDVKIDADDWNTLCRYGSLNNQAQDVMFACEKAVELSPYNDSIRGDRGVARALTGDYQGAIEDFQVLVDSTNYEEEKTKYQGWIETLKKGKNPITSEVLEELKN